jgi:hypothetical protein
MLVARIAAPYPGRVAPSRDVFTAFARDLARRGVAFGFCAQGRSMLPFVWPGTDVRIVPVDARRARIGDLALVDRGTVAILHRVVGRRGDMLLMQGDAMRSLDPPAAPEDVLGLAQGLVLGPLVWRGAPAPLRASVNRSIVALAPLTRRVLPLLSALGRPAVPLLRGLAARRATVEP